MKGSYILRALSAFIVLAIDTYIVYTLCTGNTFNGFGIFSICFSVFIRCSTTVWLGDRLNKDEYVIRPSLWVILSLTIPVVPLLVFGVKGFLREKTTDSKDKKNITKILNLDKRWRAIHTIILLIIIGFGIVVVAEFELIQWSSDINSTKKWNGLLITLGSTVLLAGVSSIILQVFSSIRFFQQDLVKTFYDIFSADARYLETIDYKQLRENWKVLSTHLYRKKFSELSDDLHNLISNEYFPRNHPVYYEDYRLSANIKLEEEERQFIKLEETINLDIVANDKDEMVYYDFETTIPCFDANATTNKISTNKDIESSDSTTKVVVSKFTINGNNYLEEDKLEPCIDKNGTTVERNRDLGKSKHHYYRTKPFNGKKRYSVVVKQEKTYSLKTNQIKSFQAVRIINGMTINIEYDSRINIEFLNRGTVNSFESIGENLKNSLLKRYKGLILPHQGYIMAIRIN